jgi:hypothetical protein
MVKLVQLVILDILQVVVAEDMKPIVDTMEKVVLVVAETQDQDQEQVQVMDRLVSQILAAAVAEDPEVHQEQTLVKTVVTAVKELLLYDTNTRTN